MIVLTVSSEWNGSAYTLVLFRINDKETEKEGEILSWKKMYLSSFVFST